jgi:hypothetical protein
VARIMKCISDVQPLIKTGHSNTRLTQWAREPQNVNADIDESFRSGIA